MGCADADEIHISVQAAVEGEIRHLRVNGVVRAVVHSDDEQRFAGEFIGDIDAPCGVAAVVVRHVPAVCVDIGRGVGAADLEIIAVGRRQIELIDRFCVIAGAAVEVISAVLSINRVPGVGQIDPVPPFGHGCGNRIGHFCECPLGVQIIDRSH